MATGIKTKPLGRSARLGLRATQEQEAVLRRGAEVSHKSLTEFILDSACQAAENALLDQRLFLVPAEMGQKLTERLDRPTVDQSGLRDLFSRKAPWENF